MAGIDSSIYFQQQTPDILGSVQKGLSMRDMLDQRQMRQDEIAKQKGISQAYSAGMTTGPDGKVVFDRDKTLSSLSTVPNAGKEAFDAQTQFRTQDAADLKLRHEKITQQADWLGRAANGMMANKGQGYDQMLAQAKQIGYDTSMMPPVYGPDAQQKLNYFAGQAMTAKDQIELDAKKRGLDIQQQEANIKQQNANTENRKVGLMGVARQDGIKQKMADSLKKDLDADAGRTGNFGKISARVQQADYLDGLVNQFPDGNLNTRQIEELSLGLANMLSGSSGASRSQVEALVPHTWTGKMANVEEWLKSEPKGAQQQAFVKQMAETVQREREVAHKQMNDIREQRLSAHRQYSKADPQGFNSQLQSYGLDPSAYDENLLPKAKSKGVASAAQTTQSVPAQAHPEANAAVQWAKQNPSDPRARDIMQRLGQ